MSIRGNRKAIIAIITASSLVAVAAIATVVFFTMRSQQRSDDVDTASRIAKAYVRDLDTYRDDVWTAVLVPGTDHPRATRAALRKARVDPPQLPDAPAWGEKHSASYAKAATTQNDLQADYDRLDRVLRSAIAGEKFLRATRVTLKVDAQDFVKSGTISDGAQKFRTIMIPGLQKALRTFDDVPVPSGGKQAAKAVRAHLASIIDQAEVVADKLQTGQGGTIDQNKTFTAATTAADAYEQKLRQEVGDGIETIAMRSTASAT